MQSIRKYKPDSCLKKLGIAVMVVVCLAFAARASAKKVELRFMMKRQVTQIQALRLILLFTLMMLLEEVTGRWYLMGQQTLLIWEIFLILIKMNHFQSLHG